LAIATFFTPIPGDEVWGAARLARWGIYVGIMNGKIVYIGRTSNFLARFNMWTKSGKFRVVKLEELSNLTYREARAIEDYLIRTTRGGPKYIGGKYRGGKLWNKRNEVSDKHSYHKKWYDWARDELERRGHSWPDDWL
jgi:hypothetical protein